MQDAWRAYLEMALGLTEAPRKRAQKVAGDLVNRGGATAAQLQGLVEDLMSTGMANREALTNIVRYEVDRALGLVGLATSEEVSDLTTRVRDLERQLRDAQARAAAAEAGVVGPGGPATVAKKTVAKKAVAKKAVKKATPNAMPAAATTPPATAKKAVPAKKAAPTNPSAVKSAATPAKVAAPAKKTAAKKTAAKKTAAKKTAAKKTTGNSASEA
jgi:polyhydroxyalkanoate synthesis regulator phasin